MAAPQCQNAEWPPYLPWLMGGMEGCSTGNPRVVLRDSLGDARQGEYLHKANSGQLSAAYSPILANGAEYRAPTTLSPRAMVVDAPWPMGPPGSHLRCLVVTADGNSYLCPGIAGCSSEGERQSPWPGAGQVCMTAAGVNIYVLLYVCMHVCMKTDKHESLSLCMSASGMHEPSCMFICIHVVIHARMHTCVFHIYI